MKFDLPSEVEQVCYEFKLADFTRAVDRARINELFNGVPPYTAEEVSRNNIAINVNFLEATRLGHDARMQFTGNFLKPGRFFNCRTDMGAKHKRIDRSAVVTHEIAKLMKQSSIYYETFRSKFALDILHGIGPSAWDKPDYWCPDAIGVEDVLVPANTMLTMKNLPFFSVYHSYTGPELARLTRDRKKSTAAGWNMDLVDKCLEYIDRESMSLLGTNWPEVWSPEKAHERVKGDGGFYAGDQVPTIDCFDFYFWDDDQDREGWKRRIILDSWSTPQGAGQPMGWNSKVDWAKNQFLFNSGQRKVAQSWKNLVSFQFADLSAVGPFRYHSIRSLGYLLYAVCHLQNRLRCKFNECVFEAMMMYFRIKSSDEAERALKVELFNRGFIDESLQFIPAQDRFQVNANLVQLGLSSNEQIINLHAASYTQTAKPFGSDATEKTKFQVMAELQSMTAMISAGLQQAYRYQEFEYQEIFRRFCLKNSRDPDIISFRGRCLSQGVPESMLILEAWDIEPERVLGAGNRTLEMAIAEQLMSVRHLYDPEPQRQILRDFTLAVTEDPGRTENMVPLEANVVTDSVHDAQLASAALMQGLPVALKKGISHIEYVDTLLVNFQLEVGKVQSRGGVPTLEKLEGFHALYDHLNQHIEIVAEDENEKERVVNWQKQIMRLMNAVKAFSQRLQEQMQAQSEQGGNGQLDPKDLAKIQAMQLQAQAKQQNTRESHAQRTAQRQVQFELEEKRAEAAHRREMQREQQRAALELAAKREQKATELAAEQQKNRMRSMEK